MNTLHVATPKEIQLELAYFLEEEDKVVTKRECLALKSPSACKGLEGARESHPVTLHFAVDGILHADQEGNPFFQAEVGMDPETTHVTARHFVRLPMMVRQQQETTARGTNQGRNYPFQAEVGVNLRIATAQVAARQEFARLPMSRQQQGMIAGSNEQNKRFDSGK